MIKLKLNKEKLDILFVFANDSGVFIRAEKAKFIGKKRTIEFVQLQIQLEEMIVFKKKLEILKIKKADLPRAKLFSITISPIQSLLILMYAAPFIKQINDQFSALVLNEQKDIIFRDLLTK